MKVCEYVCVCVCVCVCVFGRDSHSSHSLAHAVQITVGISELSGSSRVKKKQTLLAIFGWPMNKR